MKCIAGQRSVRAWCLAVTLSAVVTGCRGSEKGAKTDTAALGAQSAVSAPGDTTNAAASDTGCVKAGDWSECNLLDRLESSGLAPRRAGGAIRQPFLTVPGFVVALGDAEIQAYLYPDTLALKRDLQRLDTVRVAPPTMQVTWRATPTLIRSNNLLAILLSNDETQVERVKNAITAGLPAARATP